MDKTKEAAEISVTYGTGAYSVCRHRSDVTELEVINSLCKEASEDGRVIVKASIKMVPMKSILTRNDKSL